MFLKLRDVDNPSSASASVGAAQGDGEAGLFDSDSEEDEESRNAARKGKGGPKVKLVEVEFDLTLSAFANARKMYTQRKVATVKEARTLDSSARALQQVGDRVLRGVENQKLKRTLRAVRKVGCSFVFFIGDYLFNRYSLFISRRCTGSRSSTGVSAQRGT